MKKVYACIETNNPSNCIVFENADDAIIFIAEQETLFNIVRCDYKVAVSKKTSTLDFLLISTLLLSTINFLLALIKHIK